MIAAGKYRHLVRVQKRVLTPDGRGGSTEKWTQIGQEFHARVTPTAGFEATNFGQVTYAQGYRVSMRYLAALTPVRRVIWEDGGTSRILNVLSAINPDGRRHELVLNCVEEQPVPGPVGN